MKILLDTNVWISAFLTHGSCAELLEYLLAHHTIITSKYIIHEIEEKLLKKFKFTKSEVGAVVGFVKANAQVVIPVELSENVVKADPKDDAILGSALGGEVTCIITGDKDLLNLGSYESIPIIRPADFWEWEAQ